MPIFDEKMDTKLIEEIETLFKIVQTDKFFALKKLLYNLKSFRTAEAK